MIRPRPDEEPAVETGAGPDDLRDVSKEAPALARAVEASQSSPDHAWKTLTVTNEWIRHADTKTGIIAAFAGVCATLLYNLVKQQPSFHWTLWRDITAGATMVGIVATVVCAGAELFPRTSTKRDHPKSLLFYGDIHASFHEDPSGYAQALGSLTQDPVQLVEQIADQISINATIANTKFRWTQRAVRCIVAAFTALVATGILVVVGW